MQELDSLETAINKLHNSGDVTNAAYTTITFGLQELKNHQQRLLDALLCVEFISMHQEDLPRNLKTDKERELHSAHGKIYRLSHVARNPSCIAKHEDWEKELKDFIPIAKN